MDDPFHFIAHGKRSPVEAIHELPLQHSMPVACRSVFKSEDGSDREHLATPGRVLMMGVILPTMCGGSVRTADWHED